MIWELHSFSWVNSPIQSSPPWAVAGFVHVLLLAVTLPRHVAGQGAHSVQSVNPPFTVTTNLQQWCLLMAAYLYFVFLVGGNWISKWLDFLINRNHWLSSLFLSTWPLIYVILIDLYDIHNSDSRFHDEIRDIIALDYVDQFCSPGQGWMLHGFSSHCTDSISMLEILPPRQNLPPKAGEGASQLLFLLVMPPPQSLVQAIHDSHASHCPCTITYTLHAIVVYTCTTPTIHTYGV